MGYRYRLVGLLARISIVLAVAAAAPASTISYVGNLSPDDANDFALFQFTLTSNASVGIQTWGYGGGTNGAGTVIAPGGFDPYVSLFLGTGDTATFLASNDDGLCPPGNGSVACQDATLFVNNLAPGSYTVALSVFENMSFAENLGSGTLGDGFIGLGNYYDAASDSVRTPAYALDITQGNITQTPAPEPGTTGLILGALLLAAVHSKTK